MKVIDDSTKKLHWWNRNYFFAGTILIVVINILLQAFMQGDWTYKIGTPYDNWSSVLNFDNIIRAFINSFAHANWQHVLLNMLCFFVAGIYLERKKGTLPLLGLVAAMTFFTAVALQSNNLSIYWAGFSGVNYGIYGYIIVDFIFMFRKETRTKFNIISGVIILGLIYFAMCFNGGTSSIGFSWYPYDLMHNMGHYSSFVAGIILALVIYFTKVITLKQSKKES